MISIEHVANSSLAGTRQDFDRPLVRIGRRPECDVRFDATRDTSVSGQHAELRRDGEQLFARDLGSTNGTWVNGVRISGEAAVRAGDVLRLGQNGPEFRIAAAPSQRTAAEMPASSVKRGIGAETLGREIERATLGERRKSRRALFMAGGFVLAIVAVVAVWQMTRQDEIGRTVVQTRSEVDESRRAAEEARRIAADAQGALQASLAEVKKEHQAELAALKGQLTQGESKVASLIVEIEDRDRAMRELDAKATEAIGGGNALAAQMDSELTRLREELARAEGDLRQELKASSADWADLVDKYKESIFLCLCQTKPDANGSFAQAIGTAWVCRADGLLATNAHVSEMFEDRSHWNVMLAVQNHTGQTFAVRDVTKHKGWTGDPSGPDVGLIRIVTFGETFTPLPIASEAQLRELRIGTQLGTIGYPGELNFEYTASAESSGELLHAQATFKDGWIGRILDFSGKRADFSQSRQIQHSASLSGGTSGSPMFTHDGHVVALNNSGIDLFVKVKTDNAASDKVERMSNPAEIGFAVRVDILEELIRDSGW